MSLLKKPTLTSIDTASGKFVINALFGWGGATAGNVTPPFSQAQLLGVADSLLVSDSNSNVAIPPIKFVRGMMDFGQTSNLDGDFLGPLFLWAPDSQEPIAILPPGVNGVNKALPGPPIVYQAQYRSFSLPWASLSPQVNLLKIVNQNPQVMRGNLSLSLFTFEPIGSYLV